MNSFTSSSSLRNDNQSVDYRPILASCLTNTAFQVVSPVDSEDWKDYGADAIVDTVVNHKHLDNGSIILCHNGAKFTKDALQAMITGLQDEGYTIVPISELIYTGKYYVDNEGRQFQK